MHALMERVWKPSVEISPNCPRCGCSNTKFCYYNNYSLTQPRYFCKGCRRYWTKGGSLRNVPVGGGCRKNRRGISKSLRLSSDSKSGFGYGSSAVSPIGHCYGVNSTASANLSAHSATTNRHSSMLPDGSHIDLALVYANFLSQKPDLSKCTNDAMNNDGSKINELGVNSFDPSLEFSTNVELVPQIGTNDHHQLQTENHDQQIFLCGLDSFQNRSCEFGLPPLPSQEPILWSNSHNLMVSQTVQVSRDDHPTLGPEEADHQEENLLNGNWSPFNLPSHDTFSGGNENI